MRSLPNPFSGQFSGNGVIGGQPSNNGNPPGFNPQMNPMGMGGESMDNSFQGGNMMQMGMPMGPPPPQGGFFPQDLKY